MAVLLANRSLGVRSRTTGTDAHGYRSGPSWGSLRGPWPGRAEQGPDAPIDQPGGRTWVLAVDPRAWPVYQGDLVEDPVTGMGWLVISADLLANNADDSINYIRVEAHGRISAETYP